MSIIQEVQTAPSSPTSVLSSLGLSMAEMHLVGQPATPPSAAMGAAALSPSSCFKTTPKGNLIYCPESSMPSQSVGVGGSPFSPTKVSTADIVAFGGIPEPSSAGLRSSNRLRAQPNADVPMLERAMKIVEQRDSPSYNLRY